MLPPAFSSRRMKAMPMLHEAAAPRSSDAARRYGGKPDLLMHKRCLAPRARKRRYFLHNGERLFYATMKAASAMLCARAFALLPMKMPRENNQTRAPPHADSAPIFLPLCGSQPATLSRRSNKASGAFAVDAEGAARRVSDRKKCGGENHLQCTHPGSHAGRRHRRAARPLFTPAPRHFRHADAAAATTPHRWLIAYTPRHYHVHAIHFTMIDAGTSCH